MKSILLVEDDSFLSNIYLTKLEEAGYSVDVVFNEEEIIKKIRGQRPNLVLLDIVLPGISGWEILKKIKEERELDDIKIVILSNLDEKEMPEENLKERITKYLVKANYTPSEIVEEVKEILK